MYIFHTILDTISSKCRWNLDLCPKKGQRYYGKQIQIVYDRSEVEIFVGLSRIAIDDRNTKKLGYTTIGIVFLVDFGLQALDSNGRIALLLILEDCYACKSTIITSQLPVAN